MTEFPFDLFLFLFTASSQKRPTTTTTTTTVKEIEFHQRKINCPPQVSLDFVSYRWVQKGFKMGYNGFLLDFFFPLKHKPTHRIDEHKTG